MSEKVISRRGAFSLLGLAAALGFAVPTTMLAPEAEAQMQPTAPAPSLRHHRLRPLRKSPVRDGATNGTQVARSGVRSVTPIERNVARRGTPAARSVVRHGKKPISFT